MSDAKRVGTDDLIPSNIVPSDLVTAGPSLRGFVDHASLNGGVCGWAVDLDAAGKPVALELLLDEKPVLLFHPDELRNDILALLPDAGPVGFTIAPPTLEKFASFLPNDRSPKFDIRFVDTEFSLDMASTLVQVRLVEGYVDLLTSTDAFGWAIDTEAAETLEVSINSGGRLIAITRADIPRTDLAHRFGGKGSYGFHFTFDVPLNNCDPVEVAIVGGPALPILYRQEGLNAFGTSGAIGGSSPPVTSMENVIPARVQADPMSEDKSEAEILPPSVGQVMSELLTAGLFDPVHYLAINEDVAAAGIDPFEHYCFQGFAENRSPNPFFDPDWYRAAVGAGLAQGANPLHHYLTVGEATGISPSRLFNPVWYRANQNLDQGQNALAHYLRHRADSSPPSIPEVDAGRSLLTHADVAKAVTEPIAPSNHLLGLVTNASMTPAERPALVQQTSDGCVSSSPATLVRRADEATRNPLPASPLHASVTAASQAQLNATVASPPSRIQVFAELEAMDTVPPQDQLPRPVIDTAYPGEPSQSLPLDLSIDVRAHIEGGLCIGGGSGGLVYGWALHDPRAPISCVVDASDAIPMSAFFRSMREDVINAFPENSWSHLPSAFIGFLPHLTEVSEVRLVLGSPTGPTEIARRRGFESISLQPADLARRLFGIASPLESFAERALKVDWPLLSQSIARHRRIRRNIRRVTIGNVLPGPQVSIIVPLYGRIDFLEAQIMEFARDPFVRDNCEIIYVVDDPPKWQQAVDLASNTCALFGMSVTIVGDGANNGFSGANNLGVKASSGVMLLFLNSDVIPEEPGWLELLLETYGASPGIGAVGPRLVLADGGIQHAGMDFRFNEPLGIWTNIHPGKGFAPELDIGPATIDVAAVTGACLLTSRAQLAALDGWDEGYLIGDFEDSHLCLALRAQGKRIVYDRRAQLVHLERQSFGFLGGHEFRMKVMLTNAARHQSLWAELLSKSETSA